MYINGRYIFFGAIPCFGCRAPKLNENKGAGGLKVINKQNTGLSLFSILDEREGKYINASHIDQIRNTSII